MWAITHRHQFGFKKKKNQVKSPSPESRVPETGSDPPIGSDRDSGRDSAITCALKWGVALIGGILYYALLTPS